MNTDVAIVSFAQAPSVRSTNETEAQMLLPVINEAIESSGLDRRDLGFVCSGSADYLAGQPFSFVGNLEAVGAWPPISESHVEMDGAWALYEAWIRLQHGDIDSALVYGSGISSMGSPRETLTLQLDPYYLMPLWADTISLAALQARAVLEEGRYDEKSFAEVVARNRRAAKNNPNAQVTDDRDVDALLDEPYFVDPLRRHDCPPISDGAWAMVIVAGDRAKELCERPAWIRGMDHRIETHYPGVRDLTRSESTELAGRALGSHEGIEVAELTAPFSFQELLLRDALNLGDDTEINPSGGALAANPLMSAGLTRIGEAADQIMNHGRSRVLGHATAGPCLQQNLVCVLEGER